VIVQNILKFQGNSTLGEFPGWRKAKLFDIVQRRERVERGAGEDP